MRCFCTCRPKPTDCHSAFSKCTENSYVYNTTDRIPAISYIHFEKSGICERGGNGSVFLSHFPFKLQTVFSVDWVSENYARSLNTTYRPMSCVHQSLRSNNNLQDANSPVWQNCRPFLPFYLDIACMFYELFHHSWAISSFRHRGGKTYPNHTQENKLGIDRASSCMRQA